MRQGSIVRDIDLVIAIAIGLLVAARGAVAAASDQELVVATVLCGVGLLRPLYSMVLDIEVNNADHE